ncbi:apolipoprotein N-acyltransferase [Kytococcus aerolatus]|uniref:Apolipoprotein N-acyltransferase n=1 Tax=Kytococcus aerolatus TaxID=592308 RepID=A0A212T1V8_9MICO|nr:apolipoprotein N-acyltransferase [Kytococcus aerolatus]SNC59999.1 apolipoprotein N-acyltransferase [Kytococcus aerolatus]
MALLQRVLASLLAGTALWLSFPEANLWWAAPIGVALSLLAVRGASLRAGAGLGLLTGLAFFLPLLRWSGIYVGADAWLALGVVQALYLAPLGVLLVAVQRASARLSRGAEMVVLPALTGGAWVAQEWLRGSQPWGGFSWARLAFSQADAPTLATARYLTAAGTSAWVAAAGTLLGLSALALGHRVRLLEGSPVPRWAAPTALVAALGLLTGPLLLPAPRPDGRTLEVLAVQGDAPVSGFRFDGDAREVLTNHTELVAQAAQEVRAGRRPAPDVVFLPENAADLDPTRDAEASQLLARASWEVDSPLLVGAILREPSPMLSNAVLQYQPGEGITARYDKQHPVPFGEWIPERDLIRRLTPKVDLVPRDFAAGSAPGRMDVGTRQGVVPVGIGICFEVAYDDLMRGPVADGAEILFIPTNNASFGHTDQSAQQLAISRVRAMEHGRSVVHVSTVGTSALVAPDGSVVDLPEVPGGVTGLFEPALLQAELPLSQRITPATRLGNWPTWVLTALALAGGAAGLLRPRQPVGAPVEGTRHDGVSTNRRPV